MVRVHPLLQLMHATHFEWQPRPPQCKNMLSGCDY